MIVKYVCNKTHKIRKLRYSGPKLLDIIRDLDIIAFQLLDIIFRTLCVSDFRSLDTAAFRPLGIASIWRLDITHFLCLHMAEFRLLKGPGYHSFFMHAYGRLSIAERRCLLNFVDFVNRRMFVPF